MEAIGFLWNEIVTRPMTNGLVFFYTILGGNFGLAIIFFTIVVRIFLYPMTLRQLRSTKAMQQLQPRLKELQERYKNDRARHQREQMRLFRESGVNPLGCLGPIIIQFPIWIGLFYAIRTALADTPEGLISLSQKLYAWLPLVDEAVPLSSHFLWMDLGKPDPSPLVMPLLVGISMWVVQKMAALPSADPRQQSTTNMMNWMMPIMFGFWTLTFPSGLAVYWVISNVVSIVLQYRVTGWGGLVKGPAQAPVPSSAAVSPGSGGDQAQDTPRLGAGPQAPAGGLGGILRRIFLGKEPLPAPGNAPVAPPSEEAAASPVTTTEGVANGSSGDDRQDRRRSYRESPQSTGGRARRRRNRRRR